MASHDKKSDCCCGLGHIPALQGRALPVISFLNICRPHQATLITTDEHRSRSTNGGVPSSDSCLYKWSRGLKPNSSNSSTSTRTKQCVIVDIGRRCGGLFHAQKNPIPYQCRPVQIWIATRLSTSYSDFFRLTATNTCGCVTGAVVPTRLGCVGLLTYLVR